jgi:hypothetical protein
MKRPGVTYTRHTVHMTGFSVILGVLKNSINFIINIPSSVHSKAPDIYSCGTIVFLPGYTRDFSHGMRGTKRSVVSDFLTIKEHPVQVILRGVKYLPITVKTPQED